MLIDSSQKAIWLVLVFAYNQTKIIKPSGDSWHLTLSLVIYTEHGKPVPSPVMASRPQGRAGIGWWKKRRPFCNGGDRD
jgi:hypothetical protein